jgi:hypothetical protein
VRGRRRAVIRRGEIAGNLRCRRSHKPGRSRRNHRATATIAAEKPAPEPTFSVWIPVGRIRSVGSRRRLPHGLLCSLYKYAAEGRMVTWGPAPPVFSAPKNSASPTGVRSPWRVRRVRRARLRQEGSAAERATPPGSGRPKAHVRCPRAMGPQRCLSRDPRSRVTEPAVVEQSGRGTLHGSRDASPDRHCAEQPC